MSVLEELQKNSQSTVSTGKEDGTDGQKSDCNPLPEEMSIAYQKLQKIAEKEGLILDLLKRVELTIPEHKDMSHELTLVEKMLQEVKTELSHVQSTGPQTEPAPDSCVDPNRLFSEDRTSLVEKKSTHEALWQAEQTVKHLRHNHVETKESVQESVVVQPQEISFGPRTPHATSVLVGKGNTAVLHSTVNIINIGDSTTQVQGSDLLKILESVSDTLKSSSTKDGVTEPCSSDMLPSAGGADETGTERPKLEKQLTSTLQQSEQWGERFVSESHTVTITSEHLSHEKHLEALAERLSEIGDLIEERSHNSLVDLMTRRTESRTWNVFQILVTTLSQALR